MKDFPDPMHDYIFLLMTRPLAKNTIVIIIIDCVFPNLKKKKKTETEICYSTRFIHQYTDPYFPAWQTDISYFHSFFFFYSFIYKDLK